ncbi:TPA: tRNA (cytosine(32)/uridine(32)-2'-O)-methyltransferase TrmJ [Serratia fonticola]|jgi:tRNA (cytidine32/uridine32-2'-O)-methyltransferase|uniref:tRNA (cytosine(32)/uridine(32)-2'-O)-methyltransferase TrmJ n=1 Tax=Serratia fonticola TaxID=47917 RepID=UPI0015765E2D|nr:tRNA (cytosine(32)/uridine(32)-2'-O)-methyltransferase TrmJ [Serratia fonticola]NTY89063.1 tRNA (cytosine(32)/uridine(32)-2'-O)-methyltransferase TrmJ [Serratia fonticola]NTZ14625.1 tRNA (cytosine(32)/uridine(32)-2'-O)-methyltransferase TrmJ [Serratia fonticola]CAI0895056.1 tRNA (cytidine/uridine-2'-O-)-methyltransferase TrmJ [Serratia fonticola]CAI0974328.1 tRNA (cytidine/uridine-2'-O-)-methyltransferase TrmJ [Serratia fonticola]HBE9178374.1 tRNA (cytosine(32)/uridine(32)-2'-O)-methyltrans
MLHNIRIVLVETSHTGNMGSTARAMKTMGLTNLYLVNPLVKPDSQAIALAAGASDVIGNATIVDTFDEAIAGCRLVVGTSARSRTLPWPMLEPRECGVRAVQEGEQGPVALVFGRERVGLTNDELQKCHYHVAIPANPEYSSLNLAMAVQILAYEVRVAFLDRQQEEAAPAEESPYPLVDDIERFYQHLEQTLVRTGFIRAAHPGQVMNRLRRLFARARPEAQELNILRGMLTSIEKQDKQQGN